MVQEAWFSGDTAIIIQEEGKTETALTTDVLSINQSGFERETEGIVTFGNGRITQKKPQADGTVEIELVFTDTQLDKIFWGSTVTTAAPATVYSGGEQNAHRITIIRTDAELPTTAIAAITGETYRVAYANAYAVTLEPEQEADGYLKAKLTFKVSPTDDAAVANVRTDYLATGSLSAFGAYTASNKW